MRLRIHGKEYTISPYVDLQEANLEAADLWGANLWRANLREANLWGADLWRANLREANLWGANLWGADLRGADLQRADLREANLWGADLRGADLRGADLRGTDLRGTGIFLLYGFGPYTVIGQRDKLTIGCQSRAWDAWHAMGLRELSDLDKAALWYINHQSILWALYATIQERADG